MNSTDDATPHFEVVKQPRSRLPLAIAAALGVAVLAALLWLYMRPPAPVPGGPPPLPPMTAEAEAYLTQVKLAGPAISRWENFLGQEVTYVDFVITNRGPRPVAALELTIEFRDREGRVALAERLQPIGPHSPRGQFRRRLGSGQSAEFRAGFEELPAAWDKLPPRGRITGLVLE